jgi:maleate isomerase
VLGHRATFGVLVPSTNTIVEVNRPDVDTIVQVETNLSMLRLADEVERWLGKPVIAVNAATFWYALRENGFLDQVRGFGCLRRDH